MTLFFVIYNHGFQYATLLFLLPQSIVDKTNKQNQPFTELISGKYAHKLALGWSMFVVVEM